MSASNKLSLYTDGSCIGNPGTGGWAFVAVLEKPTQTLLYQHCGRQLHTTNNRMELLAYICAVDYACQISSHLDIKVSPTIYVDSTYVLTAVSKLILWSSNNWRSHDSGHHVKNVRLLSALRQVIAVYANSPLAKVEWIKAHSGHKYNEMADTLAKAFARNTEIELVCELPHYYPSAPVSELLDEMQFYRNYEHGTVSPATSIRPR